MARLIAASLAATAALASIALACGSTVEVGAGGNSSGGPAGAGASEDCVPCKPAFFTPYTEGVPNFCPGEREKWDALIACACRADTCAKDQQECKVDPTGDGPVGPGEICDDGELGGECGICLREHCPVEYEACGGK